MRTVITDKIDEKTTPVYKATIKDAEGTPIPLDQITTLTMNLWNQATRSIINSRQDQNILNLNGVIVDPTSGALKWTMAPADTTIENPALSYESRVAQFVWTYSGGNKRGTHEILFTIRNLEKVS
jgi:hypothetical protein